MVPDSLNVKGALGVVTCIFATAAAFGGIAAQLTRRLQES